MKKKNWLIVLVIVMLAISPIVVFAGGGKEDTAAAAPRDLKPNPGEAVDEYATRIAKELAAGQDITIRTLVTWDAPGKALLEVIPQWEAATGIKVETEFLSTLEMSQKINLELSSGKPEYDIIQYDKYIYKPVLENPGVANLDPFMDKYDIHYETMMTGMGEWGVADDGTNRMTPFYWCTYSMAYRKDLLDNPKEKAAFKAKYGYEYDVNNLTWDKSYKDVAEFFTRDTDKDGEIDFWGTAEMLAPYAAGDTFFSRYINYWNADKPYLSDPAAMKSTMNDAAARSALKDMMDVIDNGSMIPEIMQTDWGTILGSIGSGRCAIALCYTPSWGPLQSATSEFKFSGPDKIGFAHIPGIEGKQRSTISSGWLSFVTNNSPISEIAYLYLLWTSSEKIDKEMALTTLHMPVRQATYRDSEVIKLNPSFKAEAEHIEGQVAVPPLLIYEETQLIISNNMAAMVAGDITVDECVTNSDKEINAKWDELK